MNAMLSFAYAILANDCAAALEAVGLDPYVGFLHGDRPGGPRWRLTSWRSCGPALRIALRSLRQHACAAAGAF
jgi:CRISPR-associated protein Cas1